MADTVAVALQWLATDDARAAATHELASRSLPITLADDLLGVVAVSVASRFSVGGADDVDDLVAYVRRAVSLRAVDFQRGEIRERRRRAAPSPTEADRDPSGEGLGGDAEDASAGFAIEAATAEALADDLRRALHPLVGGTRPWAAAAALTVITLTLHRDVAVPPQVPAPDGGDDAKAIRWAALYLAGERDCFAADGATEDPAMRKRRSRALRLVDRTLTTAGATCDLGASDG